MARVAHDDLPVPPTLEVGVYEHYRGARYEVVGVALDTETLEPMVIYKPLYESHVPYWVRSYTAFTEWVTVDGLSSPRFRKV